MKIWSPLTLLALVLLADLYQSPLAPEKKRELANKLAGILFDELIRQINAKGKEACTITFVPPTIDAKLAAENENQVLTTGRCQNMNDSAFPTLKISLKMSSADGFIFELENRIVSSQIKINEAVILNEVTMRYLKKCAARFADRFENVAKSIEVIKADITALKGLIDPKITDKAKAKGINQFTIGEIKDKFVETDKLKVSYNLLLAKIKSKPIALKPGVPAIKDKEPQAEATNLLIFDVTLPKIVDGLSSATVVLSYLPEQNLILTSIYSTHFEFTYDFNVMTRPFIINCLQNLLLRIGREGLNVMKALSDPYDPTQFIGSLKAWIQTIGFEGDDTLYRYNDQLALKLENISSNKELLIDLTYSPTVMQGLPSGDLANGVFENSKATVQMAFPTDSVQDVLSFAKTFILSNVARCDPVYTTAETKPNEVVGNIDGSKGKELDADKTKNVGKSSQVDAIRYDIEPFKLKNEYVPDGINYLTLGIDNDNDLVSFSVAESANAGNANKGQKRARKLRILHESGLAGRIL